MWCADIVGIHACNEVAACVIETDIQCINDALIDRQVDNTEPGFLGLDSTKYLGRRVAGTVIDDDDFQWLYRLEKYAEKGAL